MTTVRINRFVPLALLLLPAIYLCSISALQAQTDLPAGKRWTPLFNGEDLTGWNIAGQEKWDVVNGELAGESGPHGEYGYLFTEESYTDFELYLEFKLEGGGNSGVFFRSVLDGKRISGWQVEVAPPGEGTGCIYETHGRGWLTEPDDGDALIPGDWNRMRLRVAGGNVTTWLNGKKITKLKDEKIETGRGVIALQIHEGGQTTIKWRNILIKKLNE